MPKMARINFFIEDITFRVPLPRKTSQWIVSAASKEKKQVAEINYILCSDKYLLKINVNYLNHKTLTDIITFDSSESSNQLAGDIFISIERVKENALKYGCSFVDEFHRVLIHGVLHLIGYSDKTTSSKKVMRKKEDAYLSLRDF